MMYPQAMTGYLPNNGVNSAYNNIPNNGANPNKMNNKNKDGDEEEDDDDDDEKKGQSNAANKQQPCPCSSVQPVAQTQQIPVYQAQMSTVPGNPALYDRLLLQSNLRYPLSGIMPPRMYGMRMQNTLPLLSTLQYPQTRYPITSSIPFGTIANYQQPTIPVIPSNQFVQPTHPLNQQNYGVIKPMNSKNKEKSKKEDEDDEDEDDDKDDTK